MIGDEIKPASLTQIASDGPADGAEKRKLTLAEVRAKLDGKTGPRYWRSLEELADTEDFQELLQAEFPRQAGELTDPVSRRGFLKLAGASLALAGLSGCTKQPDEAIYPYVKAPEDLVLGKPMYFATAMPWSMGAQPLLVKSDAFRPIKVEGNPDHPLGVGGSDPIAQGAILDFYDPDRSQHVMYRGGSTEWPEFLAAFTKALEEKKASGGQGIYVLSTTVTSPTLGAQIKKAQAAYPQMKWLQWDPVNRDSAYSAAKQDAQYRLADADVVVSLDADFLSGIGHPGFTALARQWGRRRKLELDPVAGLTTTDMNRLYVIESTPTTTGFKADHRLALDPLALDAFAWALAGAVGAAGGGSASGTMDPAAQTVLNAIAADLKSASGKSVVIPGEQATAGVHSAALAMNLALGNVGKTVVYTETGNPMPSVQGDDIKQLATALGAGQVDWLLILGPNPVYTAPADLNFEVLLEKTIGSKTTVVHLGSHFDETAQYATWHIPQAHFLETWSDARAYDGTVSIVQPMIAPLYGGKSAHEIVQVMLEEPYLSPRDAVRANWPQLKDEQAWRKALQQGWIDGTAFTASGSGSTGKVAASAGAGAAGNGLTVLFRPDPSLWDGRFANVGWLQELPKPVSNLSWDNAAILSIPTAVKLGVEEGDVVELSLNGRKVLAPVFHVPGAADNTVLVYLGFGRSRAGRVGSDVGFDGYKLRSSDGLLFASGLTVKKTGDTYSICSTKSHYTDQRSVRADGPGVGNRSIEGDEAEQRAIVRWASADEYKKNPDFARDGLMAETPSKDDTLLYPWNYTTNSKGVAKYAWSMAIDQNSCVGCNACIASCYAENNIPVVGRHQVKVGRIMQWIRVDTYFEGDLDAPRAHLQPMLCQHCENAGCEQVCPVGATVHTPEGLNTMVYNRCVGTRYCSNNCPYKVRRFNFLLYSDYTTESYKLMRNPDVSVRSRGVMEKCSYCIQRIESAKIEADKQNSTVKDGDIVTACQQACPTDAILFGDLNDPNSRVSQRKQSKRNYSVLGDIGYRPRTTYIAEVVNLNPALTNDTGSTENPLDPRAGEGI
jgi:MoCo/4Fe-4S cofactor protein with predicted Tat translocation signal